ncbi:MAG: RimK family alpha-L-glutamate ligase [Pseudomonadota bacterium]
MKQLTNVRLPIAMGARLMKDPRILTLGLKPNFLDYSTKEQALILAAPKIYYPTVFYADLFNAMGKPTFPSYHTYKFALDKIKQTAMFNLLGVPHPKTRVFYGTLQKKTILDYFAFPFIAKKPRGSSKGNHVYLIQGSEDLTSYLQSTGPAYLQEYLPLKRDMRIIIIGQKIRLAYWREAVGNNFKTNISQGGSIIFDPIPQQAKDLALSTALKCGWDDIGLDIIEHNHQFYVLEGNVKYGTKGFKKAGIDYKQMLTHLILENSL